MAENKGITEIQAIRNALAGQLDPETVAKLGVSVAKASAICKAMGWEKVPTTEKVAVYTL